MKLTIATYLDDGRVYEYEVEDESNSMCQAMASEHAASIVRGGYRRCDGKGLTHYPPHRILKVKVLGDIGTSYHDRVRGT